MQKTAPGMTSMFPHNLQIFNGAMPPAGTRHPLGQTKLIICFTDPAGQDFELPRKKY